MLGALAASRDDQRRLVEDAGHELRTPLTSVRTNLAVLRRHPDLDAETRAKIIDDLHAETEELVGLVEEVVALARGVDRRRAARTGRARRDGAAGRPSRRASPRPAGDRRRRRLASSRRRRRRSSAPSPTSSTTRPSSTAAPVRSRSRSPAADSSCTTGARASREADAGRVFDRFYRAEGARVPARIGPRAVDRPRRRRALRRHGSKLHRARAAGRRSASRCPWPPPRSMTSPTSRWIRRRARRRRRRPGGPTSGATEELWAPPIEVRPPTR